MTADSTTRRSAFGRWFARFNAREGRLKRALLKLSYYVFILLPYPVPGVATAFYILVILAMKRLAGVAHWNELTPLESAGTLSFWGVPDVDVTSFTLVVDGDVGHPVELRYDLLLELPAVEREVRMDCVGGFRNNTIMKGVSVAHLFDLAEVRRSASRAVFHCADGYISSIPVPELVADERKGHWESLGLPDRADVGDIW